MRQFILLLTVVLLPASFVSGKLPAPREYRLRLFNTHTLERLDVVYRRGGVYDLGALMKLDIFLRDWRADKVRHYDPRLFDLLNGLAAKAGRPEAEIQVVCGYRAPATNKSLRGRSAGVAEKSLHLAGAAVDIRLPGTRTSRLRDAALALRLGGVGYYAKSDFLHVDIGRVRRWQADSLLKKPLSESFCRFWPASSLPVRRLNCVARLWRAPPGAHMLWLSMLASRASPRLKIS